MIEIPIGTVILVGLIWWLIAWAKKNSEIREMERQDAYEQRQQEREGTSEAYLAERREKVDQTKQKYEERHRARVKVIRQRAEEEYGIAVDHPINKKG